MLKDWPEITMDSIKPYKKTQLINGKELVSLVKEGHDLLSKYVYCGIFMMKAGRSYSVVRSNGKSFVQKDLSKFREEDVTLY